MSVRPAQLVRRLLTYRVAQGQQPHVDEVAAAEAPAVAQPQVGSQGADECLAVFGTQGAGLLEFDDVLPHLPVGLDQLRIDGLHRPNPTLGVGARNLRQKLAVAVGVRQFHATPILARCPATRAASAATSSVSCGNGVA